MIDQTIAKTKNFVRNHKVALTVAATALPLIALQMRNAKVLNAFLAEHNLTDEYYHSED